MAKLILAAAALLLTSCFGQEQAVPGAPPAAVVPASYTPSVGGDDSPEPFTIAEYGPSGVVPHENVTGGVWILFSRPVIALKKLDKPQAVSPVMDITPRTQGTYRWYGSRLLAFEPSAALAPATQYRVSVRPGLRSLDGAALSGDAGFTFRTEPLGLVNVFPGGQDVAPESCREIILTFNFPVDLKTISPSLRLSAAGKDVAVKVARPKGVEKGAYEDTDRFVSLVPAAELPWNTDVKVRVLAGARPRPQNYGSPEELTAGFRTLMPFSVTDVEVSMGKPAPTAVLRFNHPVDKDSIAGKLVVSIPGYDPGAHCDVWGSAVYLSRLPVPFESSFTVRVLPGVRDTYGQVLAAEKVLSVEVGPAGSFVEFHGTGRRLLEAQFPPVVAVEFQNIDEARFASGPLAHPYRSALPEPSRRIPLASVPRNTRHFEYFDLARFMNKDRRGTAFVSWSFTAPFWGLEETQEVKEDLVVQVTDIGAAMHISASRILVQAASLTTGRPVEAAAVTLRRADAALAAARTGSDGLAVLELPPGLLSGSFKGAEDEAEIEIIKGGDRLILHPTEMPCYSWNSYEPYSADLPRPLTNVYTDRGIYKPGETVSFAGTDRNLVMGKLEGRTGKYRVELVSSSSDDKPIAAAGGALSPQGGFGGQLTLPAGLEPGDYTLRYTRPGESSGVTGSADVRVTLFRRLAYSLSLTVAEGRKLIGDTLDARFRGSYLAGGAVSRGKWSWWWTRREVPYSPPGEALQDYTFGFVARDFPEDLGSGEGELSGNGTVVASQKLADAEKGRVYSYEVTATVEDVDRQALSRQESVLVFASELQLGVKLTSGPATGEPVYFVTKGSPFTLAVAAVDPDGRPCPPAGSLTGRLIREDWTLVRERGVGGTVDTRYERKEVVEKSFTIKVAKGVLAASTVLSAASSGSYIVEVEGQDAAGRPAYTRDSFYATGNDQIAWKRADERQIEIVKDKPSYRPGQTARLLIKSPLASGTYLLSVEREGILEQRTVELAGSTPVIDVPVTEDHVPVFYVFLSSAVPRTQAPPAEPDLPDFGKPRGYSGLVEIPVDTVTREITLTLEQSRKTYTPKSNATVTVTATLAGKPLAGAEIALVAADRGVLDLIDHHIGNPAELFYARWRYPDRVAHYDSRDLLLDPVTWKVRDLPGGDEKGESARDEGGDYTIRRDFNPTPLFKTGLVTGRDGKVKVGFRLPDLLTRFRVTAVAVKGDRFGQTEGELLVQNPVNVRAALPRMLRTGDVAVAGVVVTNVDARRHGVTITASSDTLQIRGDARQKRDLAAGETREIAFELAAGAPGTARITFTVDSDALKEKLEESIPVERSFVTEAVTMVGKTRDSAKEALVIPSTFAGAPGEGLELTLDSTLASALAGAIRFLDVYPYDCLEQRTSKLFAYLQFPWMIGEKGADPGAAAAQLAEIPRFANPDGGFSYWDDPSPRRSGYYVSLRVGHLIAVAQEQKAALPKDLGIDALLGYLAAGYDRQDPALQGYALYVMARLGRKEKLRADELWKRGDAVGVTGCGFLGLAYAAMGDKAAANRVLTRLKSFLRPGTRTVTLVGAVADSLFYGGETQAKALLLMLYARLQPDSQLVQGLANDLLEANTSGYWRNTSDAGWVLQAFAEIIARGGDRNADFTAHVTLGTQEIASRQFRGLSRAPYPRGLDAGELARIAAGERGTAAESGTLLPLSFTVEGKGTLYYAALLKTAIPAASAEARDEGIGVALDLYDPKGGLVEGTSLAAGTVYRARVVLSSTRDRSYLAVRVPIPAGAEPIDGSLAAAQVVKPPAPPAVDGTETEGEGAGVYQDYSTRLYDSEVRFFFDAFGRGRRDVEFSLRTTTPGTFNTPPVQAELMYQGEVFGRTAGTVWKIAKERTGDG
jgi:alpha-2-macroglobulin